MSQPCIQENRIEKIENKVDDIASINVSLSQIKKDIAKVTSKVSYMEKGMWLIVGYCLATFPSLAETVLAKII